MDPLLVVIVSFGLIFVVTASLGQGLGVARASMGPPLKAHSQLNVMLLISTFIVVPAIVIGLGALLPFSDQVKMAIIVLGICGGAPFVPWLVSLAKGNVGYGAAATTMLLLATLIVLPLAVPALENALGTGADVTAWKILWPLLLFMLLPFLIGVLIRSRSLSLTMALGSWLGPVSITFLMAHIVLFIGYSWSDFVSIAGYGQMAYSLVFPLVGMLVGYLLSPPYVLNVGPAPDSHRGSKIVSAVAVAQQNTGAVICCAIFAFGRFTVAGDMMLLGAIVTIVVVMLTMAELGARFEKKQNLTPSVPAPALLVAASVAPIAPSAPAVQAPAPAAPASHPEPAQSAPPPAPTPPTAAPRQAAQGDN
jgi:BASS family bile acid:Na+ symporter